MVQVIIINNSVGGNNTPVGLYGLVDLATKDDFVVIEDKPCLSTLKPGQKFLLHRDIYTFIQGGPRKYNYVCNKFSIYGSDIDMEVVLV